TPPGCAASSPRPPAICAGSRARGPNETSRCGRPSRLSLPARRLLLLVPTLVGVATLVFAFLHLVPGDPVEIMLGESAAPADVAPLRHELGLDRPLAVEYVRFLGRAARGDLGRSIAYRVPVAQVIASRYPATLELAAAAFLIALAAGVPLGVAAVLIRLTRATMLSALRADHVRTARAKGVPGWRIVFVHALRNAAGPIAAVAGLQAGALLAGTVITETIFAWPGLGRLVVQAIDARDFPLVQGCVLVIGA